MQMDLADMAKVGEKLVTGSNKKARSYMAEATIVVSIFVILCLLEPSVHIHTLPQL